MNIKESVLKSLDLFKFHDAVLNKEKYEYVKALITIIGVVINMDEFTDIIDIETSAIKTENPMNPYDIKIEIYFADIIFLDAGRPRDAFMDVMPRLKHFSIRSHTTDEESCTGVISIIVDGCWDGLLFN